ncbi:hypothetical protein LTR10_011826 [Elasticomyces elasticus]|uniref:Acyl-CoA dehydrogenase n=1 Tax=Exophiala sideris TaxID=1016849 RepID=A0ABR0JDN5_9EURO|nr:hypothetical protein LTR10_011826 [Elasticomyces elasticus]KAK5031717.1 hypothetical protein LTS07_004337 [Exophiala sideris]KAK5040646.1 hypothetical protein LTR13_002946 [Exophiala sideris]KAK5062020.1 hypothetical protein LTR69_005204 [Exophiala sideris]KAK5184720.1 hypothetical protein LTR44_003395 [Eurotiomycetes sp. CCFEE 6388]
MTTTAPYADPPWISRDVSPYYTLSHRVLQREAREYVSTSITPFCEEWERQSSVPQDVILNHARLGYMAVSVYPLAVQQIKASGQKLPGNIEPDDWDGFHDLIVIDEIARCGYLGIVWALSCGNSIGAPPLINFGSDDQKKRFLPDMLTGKSRFCLGVTEPDAGSDVAGILTTAERKDDVYVVNGSKKWITNGIFADYCTAAVRTGGDGRNGISTLIIPMKASGVTCRKIENSGVSASGSTYIEFDDVEVPVANLLGAENRGFDIVMSNFNHERLWLACTSLRMARVCAEDAYAYATRRETFGKALITNQVILAKIAGFGRAIEPVHAYMESLVFIVEHERKRNGLQRQGGSVLLGSRTTAHQVDLNLGGMIATLKTSAGRALEHVNREAQQILGGAGYSRSGKGARIEQISRDMRVMVVGGGSEEILSELAVKLEKKELETLARRQSRL